MLETFRRDGRWDWPLLTVFVFLNGVVLSNAIRHDPRVAYDGDFHVNYLNALAAGHLPTPLESTEFFSPPLPYVAPALALAAGATLPFALKLAQLVQAFLCVVLSVQVARLAGRASALPRAKVLALAALAMFPAFYKSFAFMRGEPYVAALALVFLNRWLDLFTAERVRTASVVMLGVLAGALVLSRQWAVFVFPPAVLVVAIRAMRERARAKEWLVAMVIAMAIAPEVGGWFYASLELRYGSALAFNRLSAPSARLTNLPASFYTDLAPSKIFSRPVRPSFPNRLWPLFYSEFWGDYWGYWLVNGWDTAENRAVSGPELEARCLRGPCEPGVESNQAAMAPYLGRVNLVSLFPSALLCVGLLSGLARSTRFALARERSSEDEAHSAVLVLTLTVLSTFAGYAWFLIRYPNPFRPTGDTIKATYVLQTFGPLAVLLGCWLAALAERSRTAYLALISITAVAFAHNLPTLFTHFTRMP